MGKVIRPFLSDQARVLRISSRGDLPIENPNEEFVRADLVDFDQALVALDGVDSVVHLAGIPDEAPFAQLVQGNIVATQNLYEAARRAGVKRVVFASTNHVVGCYPTTAEITADDPPRPDTFYGVSKVFGEALARLYFDKWGIESVCLRIGSFRDKPKDVRQLSTWLSHRDGVELVLAALRAERVGYAVVFGISDNTRKWWDMRPAEELLGYRAQDDAEAFAGEFGESISEFNQQGGAFASPEYIGGLG
jgi:uronate dehydrogenase